MDQAGQEAMAGSQSRAQAAQQEASESLESASEALEKAASEAGNEHDAKERLKELQAEQEKIRERLKDLEDLLKKAQSPEAADSAQSAEQKMEDAERQMESGSSEKAQKSAEEARRYLEQAKQDLARERRRYEELRQEELIFRLVEDLKEFQKEQERVRDAVKALDEAASGRNLTRPERRSLKTLSADETKLRGRVDERVKALEKEGSPAFGTALEGASVDMAEIARLLEDEKRDRLVSGLCEEVIHQLADLVAAFEEEIKRREEPQGQGQKPPEGQEPQGGRQPLVPPIVEIKLLRRLQLDLNGKLESFWSRSPAAREGTLTDAQKRLLERLSNQQTRIADDLERLVQSVYGSGQGR